MIASLIGWCIRNRSVVLVMTLAVMAGGVWSAARTNVDAIPDLSDVQVIVRTEYPGRAPQIVEDQVTYPLTTQMMSVPHAAHVRGFSMFGTSFVYIIFDDGTDLYWARSRVLEQLDRVAGQLPQGVAPVLGPDATGVGWILQYVLVTETSEQEGASLDLSELRSLQDWFLRYELTAVDGVSEVASLGGFVKQYQIVVDPMKLLAHGISLRQVHEAVRRSNVDVGGRVVEMSETEFMVRGLGTLGSLTEEQVAASRINGESLDRLRTSLALEELGMIALRADAQGAATFLGDVAEIRVGPDIRRGIAEWSGLGETVGGIVIMRHGENARATIERVRDKLADLEASLPPGVRIEIAYDRSILIDDAVHTLRGALLEEMLVVSLITILFLLHARSVFVALLVLPIAVLVSLGAMQLLGISANIMSLGGIAIAIGVIVDSSIVMVDNAHKHLQRERERVAASGAAPRPHAEIIADAACEVGPTLFVSLLIITVSFLPVFVLGEQAGRLFKPLAYTKTFTMASAAIIAVTVIPVFMVYFIRERLTSSDAGARGRVWFAATVVIAPALVLLFAPIPLIEDARLWATGGWMILAGALIIPQRIAGEADLPMSRLLHRCYDPVFRSVMHWRRPVSIATVIIIAATVWPAGQLGSEFMPPLEEGDLLYMPTTDPGLSTTKARQLLQQTDKLIMQFPEVKCVMGKVGRAETATDPAPMTMIETTITLHRDKSRWRHMPIPRFFDGWPEFLQTPLRLLWAQSRPITVDELRFGANLPDGARLAGLDETVNIPGLKNSWTMPIRTRIDMLATGVQTPVGVKVMGSDLAMVSQLSEQIALALRTDDRTKSFTGSAFADRNMGGNYLDIRINRQRIARLGLNIADVQDVIAGALGGANVTHTIEGLQRYPVNIRYPHELRDSVQAMQRVLVSTPTGAQVPLEQVATISTHKGPSMIKSEGARLTSWVYVEPTGIDVGEYIELARGAVADAVDLPAGYNIIWTGQFEQMQAARDRLLIVVPLTGGLIVLLLLIATQSWWRVAFVLLAIPLSFVGAIWLLWFLDYNMSVAVWVGLIALAGLEAETGLVLLTFLDRSCERRQAEGRLRSTSDVREAVFEGAVQRVRPITMTELTTFAALLPLLWASGAGADTMSRLAAPMVGGVVTGYLGMLVVFPVVYYLVRARSVTAESSSG